MIVFKLELQNLLAVQLTIQETYTKPLAQLAPLPQITNSQINSCMSSQKIRFLSLFRTQSIEKHICYEKVTSFQLQIYVKIGKWKIQIKIGKNGTKSLIIAF